MNLHSQIKISETLFSQEVDDETIVLDTTTQEYYNFTDFGKVIWDMILEGNSLIEIHKELEEFTDIDSKELKNDILTFIESLEQKKLIEIIN